MTDGQIAALATGEDPTWQERARDELYRRFEKLVWHAVNSAARRFEAGPDDIADAFLEAWVRVLEKTHLYDTRSGKLSGFIWTIAYRASLSFFGRALGELAMRPEASAEREGWDGVEVRLDVADCLAELGEGQAEVVAMWSQGFTGREIGAPLGLSAVRAFKTLIYPAINMLKDCMGRKGYSLPSA